MQHTDWFSEPAIARRLVGYGESGLVTPFLEPSIFMPRVLGNAHIQDNLPVRLLEIEMAQPSSLRSTHDYRHVCLSLFNAMAQQGLNPPPFDDLKSQLSEYFEYQCYEYAQNLQHLTKDHDWHFIFVYNPFQEVLQCEWFTVARSAPEALGWLLLQLDNCRVFPTGATRQADGRLTVWQGEQIVAEITQVRFKRVPPDKAERVEKAFKGIQRLGEEPRLVERLSAIPGLQNARYEDHRARPRVEGTAMLLTASNLCAQLRKMLKVEFGLEVRQSQALELTARMFGAASWNHFVALDHLRLCRRVPAVLLSENPEDFEFYRSAGEAIWAFGQRCARTPGVRPFVSANAFYGDGPYLHLQGEESRKVPEGTPDFSVCYFGDAGEIHEDYLQHAQALLDSPDLTGDLARLLGGERVQQWQRANARLGRDRQLQIGKWLFSVNRPQDPKREVLFIEQMERLGQEFPKHEALLYKAELQEEDDVIRLLGDYGRDLLLEERWPESDRLRFRQFTGL
jgi:hypothetical protein